jgi:hypothetical protein
MIKTIFGSNFACQKIAGDITIQDTCVYSGKRLDRKDAVSRLVRPAYQIDRRNIRAIAEQVNTLDLRLM